MDSSCLGFDVGNRRSPPVLDSALQLQPGKKARGF
jgi:hypothetical protein